MNFIKKALILLLIGLIYFAVKISLDNWTKNKIEITTFKIKGGYGYLLSSNNKILIKQKYIPAIQKIKVFCTENEAFKIAVIVKKKITNNESPTLSVDELKNQNINFNCIN